MYRMKQVVEALYQGRWVQGTIVGFPEGENEDCWTVNCGLAQLIARPSEEIRPVRKYHVMSAGAAGGEYRRGTLLEEFYAFDNRLALKIARQYWPGQKACVYIFIEDGQHEFVGNADEKKKDR